MLEIKSVRMEFPADAKTSLLLSRALGILAS